MRAWRRFYGENPMHLLALLGSFALAGYVIVLVEPDPSAYVIALWFLGAVIAHDLILYPLYALADRTVVGARWARRRLTDGRAPRVPAVNHVRLPVLGSALLLLIFWPSISQSGEGVLIFASSRNMQQYYGTWLALTAVLFLGSAVVYALRLGRTTLGRRQETKVPDTEHPDSETADQDQDQDQDQEAHAAPGGEPDRPRP